MRFNKQAIYALIAEKFGGNISAFCKTLQLNYTTVWRVLNSHSDGSVRFLPKFISYCSEHDLELMDYLIVER